MFDFHQGKPPASRNDGYDTDQFGFGSQPSQPWDGFSMSTPASAQMQSGDSNCFFLSGQQEHHQSQQHEQHAQSTFASSTGMDWINDSVDQPMDFQHDSFGESLASDAPFGLDHINTPQGGGGVSRLVAQFEESKDYVPPLPPRPIQQHPGRNKNSISSHTSHIRGHSSDDNSYFGSLNAAAQSDRVTSPVVSPGAESQFGSFQSRITNPFATNPGSLPYGSFHDGSRISSPLDGPSSGPFGSLDNFMGNAHDQQHHHPSFTQQMNSPASEHPICSSPMMATPNETAPGASGTPGFAMWKPPAPSPPKSEVHSGSTSAVSGGYFKPPVPTTPKPAIGSQFILELNPAVKAKAKARSQPSRPRLPPRPSALIMANVKQEPSTPLLIDIATPSEDKKLATFPDEGPSNNHDNIVKLEDVEQDSNPPIPPRPQTGTRPSREQVPAEAWESYKETIRQLYLEERKPLKEVMAIMAERHNFQATPKMYKTRFSQWGFVKNNTEDEVKRLLSMKFQRDAEGKVTEFVRNGKKVNLGTYLKRKNKTEYDLIDFEMQGQLPEHIRCRTPTPPPATGYMRSPYLMRAQELVIGNMRKSFLHSRQWEVETNTQVGWGTTMTWGADSSELLLEANFLFEARDADNGGNSLMGAFKQLEQDLKKLSPQGVMEVLLGMVNRDPGLMTALCKYLAAYSTTNFERSHPLRQIFSCLYEVQQKHGSVTVSELLWNSLPIIAEELETIYGRRHPYVVRTWVDLGLYYNHVSPERLDRVVVELRMVQQQTEQAHDPQHVDALVIRYAILQLLYLIDPKSIESKQAANDLWQTWKDMKLVFPLRDSRPNAFCYHSPLKVDPWTKRCRRRYESIVQILEEHVGVKAHPYFEEEFHHAQHDLEAEDAWMAAMSHQLGMSKWVHL